MGKIHRARVITAIVVLASVASVGSTAFSFLFPVPSWEGGPISWDASDVGTTWTVTNDSGQPIHDAYVWGQKDGVDISDAESVSVKVDNQSVSWSENTSHESGCKWEGNSSSDDCPIGSNITLDVTFEEAQSGRTGWAYFTNDNGNTMKVAQVLSNTDMCSTGSRGSTIGILYHNLQFDDDNWSVVIKNQSDYLITAITFSESPSLTMATLSCSALSQTYTSTEKVEFEYYLAPSNGSATIDATYTSAPTQQTTVSCTYTVCEVLPESANRGFTFDEGTNISVPNITIEEIEAGAIDDDGGSGEIILRPRERFDFVGVTSTSITSGNIVLDTTYISSGDIHIPILASSSTKSTITITGITIDTVTGLSEGTVSVRMTEPSDNNCNFPYANFEPEE